jgi:hypothetical protein
MQLEVNLDIVTVQWFSATVLPNACHYVSAFHLKHCIATVITDDVCILQHTVIVHLALIIF